MTEFETASLALMELNIWVVAIVGGLQCLLIGGGITAMLWANWVRSKQQDENSAALRELIEEGREQRRESSEALSTLIEETGESRAAFRDFIEESKKERRESGEAWRKFIEEGWEQCRESSEALRLTVAQGRESTEALQVLLQRQ